MSSNHDPDVEEFPRAFSDLLIGNAEDYGDKLAIVYGNIRLTWAEFNRKVTVAANALLRLYPESYGSRLAIIMENRPEYLIILYGAQRAGLIPVPISIRFVRSEIQHIFTNCNPIAFISSIHHFECVIDAFQSTKNRPTTIVVEGITDQKKNLQSWDDFLNGVSAILPDVSISTDDFGVQLYTGGTTGLPKGINFTHRALLNACALISENALELILEGKIPESTMLPTKHKIKFLVPTPLYHLSGFVPALQMTAMKQPVVFPVSLSFSPEETCELIEKEKITTVFMVPTQFRIFLDYPELNSHDLSSLTLLSSGGAKMSAEMKKEILTRFPEVTLVDGYGQTENIGAAIYSFLTVKDIPKIKEGYIGKPISGVEMQIVKENGEKVAPGEVGEAIYRSSSLMHSYQGEADSSSKTDEDTWFRTGDLFTIDEEGNYYYVDRKSEVIFTGGEKVFPTEVEAVICDHPKVEAVAVIGESDRVWGEIVIAYVQPKKGMDLTSEEIINWCVGKIAAYKKPRVVKIRQHLPIAEDGKILRSILKRESQTTE
ncbi:MAG: class I adenylate-forming enzyme family protein [Promethearchaeota archaeon]